MIKLRQLSPSVDIPTLQAQSGRQMERGVPLGWLNSLVASCRAACASEQEADQAIVYGTEHLVITVDHALTPEEETTERLTRAEQKLASIEHLLTGADSLSREKIEALLSAIRA
jgi:hypothetical protein